MRVLVRKCSEAGNTVFVLRNLYTPANNIKHTVQLKDMNLIANNIKHTVQLKDMDLI